MFVCTILCDLENFSSCLLELVLVTRFLPLHSSCQSGLQSVAVYPISATPRFWLISLNYKSPSANLTVPCSALLIFKTDVDIAFNATGIASLTTPKNLSMIVTWF